MKCLILAAGYATRLYPLTQNFPKPLLEVGGKSILDHLIEDIDRSGMVDEYIVISNGKFACHFEEWAHGKIRVVNDNTFTNETRLGAVRDIKFAIDSLGIDEELLVIAGDNLLDFSLCSFLDYYKEKKSSCVMRFYESDDQKLLKCGVLTVDQSDLVTDMYAMYDYVNFLCAWNTYYVNNYTDSNGNEVKGYYLYPADAINYLTKDGAQWNYGYKDGYFDGIIAKIKSIDPEKLNDLVANVEKAKALASKALNELNSGNYTYEYKYVEMFDTTDKVYTLNKGEELKSEMDAIYLEFSNWLGGWEM